MTIEVRRFAECAPVPWRNGAGATRTLVEGEPCGTGAGPQWRVSLADLTGEHRFSAFPDIDRVTIACGPGKEHLAVGGRECVLRDRDLIRYAGERRATCRVTAPMRNLNVFTWRQRWEAEVDIVQGELDVSAGPGGHVVVVALAPAQFIHSGQTGDLGTFDTLLVGGTDRCRTLGGDRMVSAFRHLPADHAGAPPTSP